MHDSRAGPADKWQLNRALTPLPATHRATPPLVIDQIMFESLRQLETRIWHLVHVYVSRGLFTVCWTATPKTLLDCQPREILLLCGCRVSSTLMSAMPSVLLSVCF